jgi:hypothetical protein
MEFAVHVDRGNKNRPEGWPTRGKKEKALFDIRSETVEQY